MAAPRAVTTYGPLVAQLALAAWRLLLRPLWLLLVDLVVCLARMLLPTVSCAVALAVISLMGRVAAHQYSPAFGGFIVGALAVCVVLCLLLWAQVRHRWWSS